MNNYDMALEATATALTSEGSAMRENAEYLKSFEARINKLKTTFTELSLSVGDAVLSGGILAVIEGLTSLAKVTIKVVDTLGALPPLFLTIALVMGKMNLLSKVQSTFEKAIGGIGSMFVKTENDVKKSSKSMSESMGNVVPFMTKQERALQGVEKASKGATIATRGLSASMKSLLASTGVGLLFVGLGMGIEWLVKKYQESKHIQEEIINLNKKMIDSYRSSGDGMQGMLSRYQELSTIRNRDKEQQSELNILTAKFAELLPTTVKFIDANGKATLKKVDAIEKEIKAVAELSKQEAKLKELQFTKNMDKKAKSYLDIVKDIKELKNARQELIEQEKQSSMVDETGQIINFNQDNSVEIQKNLVETLMAEGSKTEAIQTTIKAIQSQTLAYFEANGKLGTLGDSQQKIIENVQSYNEGLLRNIKNEEEFNRVYLELYNIGLRVGDVFSESFDIMTKGIENQPDKIAEIRRELGMVADSIPESFLEIDVDNMDESLAKITSGLKEIVNVSTHIESGSGDFEGLQFRLEKAGLTADQAGDFIYNLADEHENLLLRQDAYSQGFDGVNDSAENLNETLIESIDVIGKLFGYESADLTAMKTHIEYLEVMKQKSGETAEKTQEYKDSLGALSDFLGVTDADVEKNLHSYNKIIGALQKVKIATDEQGGSYLDLSEATSGLTDSEAKMFDTWLNSGGKSNIITGELLEVEKGLNDTKQAYNELQTAKAEPFKFNIAPFQKGVAEELYNLKATKETVEEVLSGNAKAVSDVVAIVVESGNSLDLVSDNITNVGESADATSERTVASSKTMKDSYGGLSTEVQSKTTAMIGVHNSQRSAIEDLGQSARDTRRDIENMNRIARSASSSNQIASRGQQAEVASYGGNVANAMSTYSDSVSALSSSTDGGGADFGGSGGIGTSGILQSPIYERFSALHGTSGEDKYKYRPFPSTGGTKKTPSKKTPAKSKTQSSQDKNAKTKELAELYAVDNLERQAIVVEGILNSLRAKLTGLNANSKEYRDTLKEILKQENSHLQISTKQLKGLEGRNATIKNRLNELKDVKKHTEAQREEYNKLQQEYDSNLSKISSLKGEVTQATIDMKKNAEAIFGDFVAEIIANYDKAIKAIDDRIDNIDFKLEVLDLTNPDDVSARIELLNEKMQEFIRKNIQYQKEKKDLLDKIKEASKTYGADSINVKNLLAELEAIDEKIEDTTINVLQAEKAIIDARGEVADEIIENLKDQYRKQEAMAIKASENETKALQKAHKEQMKIYDEKIEKINKTYNETIKSLDDKTEAEDYNAELADKNSNISDLSNKILLLSGDDSLEGKKKLAELHEELKKAQEELDKFMRDHQRDQLKEELELDRDKQIQEIEDAKETANTNLEITLEALEKEREAISENYAKILEDEERWATLRGEIIKGNFSVLGTELKGLGLTIEQITNGTFDTLSTNFATFSTEVKNFVQSINSMIGEINTTLPPSSSESGVGMGIQSWQIPVIIDKAKKGETLDDPTPDKQHLYNLVKNSTIPQAMIEEIFKKAMAGAPLSEPTPDKMVFYNLFQELIKKKVPAFDTGGYTGNWQGNSGKLALLHKKEIVLNERQTSDILNTAKLLDKIRTILPIFNTMNLSNMMSKTFPANNGVANQYNLTVKIDNLSGDKKGAELVVTEIMKGLKKRGG